MPRQETAELRGEGGFVHSILLARENWRRIEVHELICFDWLVLVFAYEERAAQGLNAGQIIHLGVGSSTQFSTSNKLLS